MIPPSLKRAMLAGLFACVGIASQASAQAWTEIHVTPDEEFYNYREGLAATPGQVLRYNFYTPAAITQVRIELSGDNGNADMKVYRDSTNAVPACDGRQAGTNELCTVGWTPGAKTPAANWLIEVSAKAAFSDAKLVVAYMPQLVQIRDLPDLPYAIAHRPTFHTNPWLESSCVQVRTGAPGFGLRERPCMPVGGQQAWDFRMYPEEYVIRNPMTGLCLSADGFWVEDIECNAEDEHQFWNVLGTPGARHFVVLQHQVSGKCMTFNADPNAASLVDCRLGEADMPGWSLRELHERIAPAQAVDGATFSLIAGIQCLGDGPGGAVLASCDDRATTRRDMIGSMYGASGKLDEFEDNFLMTTADKDRCLAVDPAAGNIVFRSCNELDNGQKWKLELYVTKIGEWQVRNVQRQQCLTTQDGGTTAGTPLALGDCAIGDTKMRWRYVGR
ncbi:RICIN domain-containing protein [Lysobacter sp. KIS68-7]|uniref:ricin-type beta-trefoil lectin domain protein n=1 Tax=Lysobacter sp. KIS68-7 TaxID=2904252 RepID=UPI001E31B43B|nr:ricin-type beta-trefoil lectin domain protein [Lysobacter sp. KIS68-7]UHQ19483.1 RICIN domain-containing protein [Lysobacter sp. KIS68-7]